MTTLCDGRAVMPPCCVYHALPPVDNPVARGNFLPKTLLAVLRKQLARRPLAAAHVEQV